MKKIIFWCPFFGKIGTAKAVINSAIALNSQTNFKCFIINSVGEFDEYKNIFKKHNIKEIRFLKKSIINFLPKNGFISSRLSFVIISILSFFPLLFFLRKNKNVVFFSYLLTSLPLLIFTIFNINSTLFLKVSGKINYTFLRKLLFKISKNKINKIFFQTIESKKKFQKLFSYNNKKLVMLEDPIIDLEIIKKLKKKKIEKKFLKKKYFISIGRLSKQKNFLFLVKCIKEIIKFQKNYNFLILGDGEEKRIIKKYILENNLSSSVFLIGYRNNVFKYLNNSVGLICTSLWEEPGFIIQEAASCKKIILTSDCYSGPSEFLDYNKDGYVFRNNNKESFISNFKKMIQEKSKHKKKINKNYKKIKLYTKKNFQLRIKKYLI